MYWRRRNSAVGAAMSQGSRISVWKGTRSGLTTGRRGTATL